MRKLSIVLMMCIFAMSAQLNAQTDLGAMETSLAAMKKEIADKTAAADKLEADIKKQKTMGWVLGGAANVNLLSTGFNDWQNGAGINAVSIGGTATAFANHNADKFFWNNSGFLELGYQRIGEKDDGNDFEKNLDRLYFASLYGYKISDVLSISALAELNTFFGDFIDPGTLTAGAGITYKPNNNLAVVFHPLTYRGIIARSDSAKINNDIPLDKNINGSFGTKIIVDYNREILKNLLYTGRLNVFLDYGDFGNPEIQLDNTLAYKFNDYLSAGLAYSIRYFENETDKLQQKHAFNIGFSTVFSF